MTPLSFHSARLLHRGSNHLCKRIHSSGRGFSSIPKNPFSKTFSIIKDDLSDVKNMALNQKVNRSLNRFPSHCDVLVVGGGVMGSSIAYWIKQRALDGLKVVVVERDPSVILNAPNSDKVGHLTFATSYCT